MLDWGVIEPSSSPWSSPVVLVQKKGVSEGEVRFAVDYSAINKICINDSSWPMPNMEDVLTELSQGKYFTTLDATSSFWAVHMDPRSMDKTAFVTPAPCSGTYRFKRMPYGLSGSSGTFCRLMETSLGEALHHHTLSFVDDTIIYTTGSFYEHLEHVQDVFNRLRRAGIKLSLKKSRFCPDEIKFLGHVVIPGLGVTADGEKTKAISDFPRPKNIRQVRGFLGMCQFFKRMIESFSLHAEPLTTLLRKDKVWNWGEEEENAFNLLKQKLMSAPVLRTPSYDRPFMLRTDWSKVAIGAILGQIDPDNGCEYVVCYGSRKLNKFETNWSPTEGEALAIVYFIQKFRFIYMGLNHLLSSLTTKLYAPFWAGILRQLISLESGRDGRTEWQFITSLWNILLAN